MVEVDGKMFQDYSLACLFNQDAIETGFEFGQAHRPLVDYTSRRPGIFGPLDATQIGPGAAKRRHSWKY